jgi:hypothetical protein
MSIQFSSFNSADWLSVAFRHICQFTASLDAELFCLITLPASFRHFISELPLRQLPAGGHVIISLCNNINNNNNDDNNNNNNNNNNNAWVISKVLHTVCFLFKNELILQNTFTGLQCNLHCALTQRSNVWVSHVFLSGRLRC